MTRTHIEPPGVPDPATTNRDNAKDRAARTWFGYGRWEAPYWFIGMEPGGTDDHASYEVWDQLGGTELIDCREHHLGTKLEKWHRETRPPTQSTRRRLIQLVLGYEGKPADLEAVRAYQRCKWGSRNGDTASLEVSALHAKNLSTPTDRGKHQAERISILGERLAEHRPKFAVFYGTKYADTYAEIAGAPFEDSYVWRGSTLCVLVRHPARSHYPDEKYWWATKGQAMRTAVEARLGAS